METCKYGTERRRRLKAVLKIGKNSEFDKLSWQRQKAIVQLFNGKTLKEVSQQAKVHRLNFVSMEQKLKKAFNSN